MPKTPVTKEEYEDEEDVLESEEEEEEKDADDSEIAEEEAEEEEEIEEEEEEPEEDTENIGGGNFSIIEDDMECTDDIRKETHEACSLYIEPEDRITKPFLSKYEKTRIIATRAQQIAYGAMPMIDFNLGEGVDPVYLAEEELKQKKTPFLVRRTLPSGHYEDWKITELEDIHLD
jgi:DNA-directed RNA polymerases I, II, and III subunit RPABC2